MNERHQELLAKAAARKGVSPGPKLPLSFNEPSGPKLTIAVFLEQSPWGAIDQDAMGKGLGGRETALVHLVMEWAKLGHDVYAFVPRDNIDILVHESGGVVRWIPNRLVVDVTNSVQPDLFVSWENVAVLDALASTYTGTTAIEMQVAHLETLPETPVSSVADYVCVLSEWAGEFIRKQHPDMPKERCPVFANGVDLARFDLPEVKFENVDAIEDAMQLQDEYHFIYSSSPDRGLHHLLHAWPLIKQMVLSEFGGRAKLHVCYGIESFVSHSRWSHREDGERALAIERLIDQDDVVYHGKIGQDELADLMIKCDLMLYPADTMSPTETGCISIVEALAAGTPVVTTDCDCIGPDYKDVTTQVPLPLSRSDDRSLSRYVVAVLEALDPEDYYASRAAGIEFAKQRDWPVIAKQWIDFFSPIIESKRVGADAKLF